MRNILNLYGYSFKDRISNADKYTKISKYLTDQGINVVSLVGLMHKPRIWNKKNIKKKYIEIYIKSDLDKIIDKKKKTYLIRKNVVGVNIKPQFPKKPDIIIENSFNRSFTNLNHELKTKIKKITKKKKYGIR